MPHREDDRWRSRRSDYEPRRWDQDYERDRYNRWGEYGYFNDPYSRRDWETESYDDTFYGRGYGRGQEYGSGGRYGRGYSSGIGSDYGPGHGYRSRLHGSDRDYDRSAWQQFGGYDRAPEHPRSGYEPDYDDDEMEWDREPVTWTYTEWWLVPGPHSGQGPAGYRRSDQRIFEDVCDRLSQHGWLDAENIQVDASNGEVTLRGSVPDRRSKRLAEDLAESVTGVSDVHNELHVQHGQFQGGQQSSQGENLNRMQSQSLGGKTPGMSDQPGTGRSSQEKK